jgi:hypothetical protein
VTMPQNFRRGAAKLSARHCGAMRGPSGGPSGQGPAPEVG